MPCLVFCYAECLYAECHVSFVALLIVIMLRVVKLSVIVLSVVMLSFVAPISLARKQYYSLFVYDVKGYGKRKSVLILTGANFINCVTL